MLHTHSVKSNFNILFLDYSLVFIFFSLFSSALPCVYFCLFLFVFVFCRCPPGHIIRVNGTRKSCVYTLCATRPCHHGTCVAQSPSKFTCHCPEGYRGRHCETTLAVYREEVGLSFSSLFAICICFMALLGKYYCCYRLLEFVFFFFNDSASTTMTNSLIFFVISF